MQVLITGATGFIGQHLLRRLLEEGYQVRALVRDPRKSGLLPQEGVEVFRGDLTDRASLEGIAQGIDLVINVAGVLGRWQAPWQEMYRVNTLGVKHLLEACLAANIQHFIQISTCGVSGPLEEDGADEGYPCRPASAYEQTKYLGEQLALELASKEGLPLTVIRPTFTYGPGDLHRLAFYRLIKRRLFFFIGRGEATLHPIYVEDLVKGIMLCMKHPPSPTEIYLLGGDRIVTIEELVRCIANQLNVRPPHWHIPRSVAHLVAHILEWAAQVIPFPPPLSHSRLTLFTYKHGYDISKARERLGYRPQTTLEEGMASTIKWYRDQELL